jgi:hypothetical protein
MRAHVPTLGERSDGTAGASLRLAKWKNGLSGGGLSLAAAAEAIRASVNNRVDTELVRAAVATRRRRRGFACEAVLALAPITALAVAVRQPCRRCARARVGDPGASEPLIRRLDERCHHPAGVVLARVGFAGDPGRARPVRGVIARQ